MPTINEQLGAYSDLFMLLAATLLPVVPVMLLHVPGEDWRALASLLTGGLLQAP